MQAELPIALKSVVKVLEQALRAAWVQQKESD